MTTTNFVDGQVLTAAELNTAFGSAASEADIQQIQNGTAPDAGALTGAETVPASRGAGLLQTTWNVVATFVLSIFAVLVTGGAGAVARTILALWMDLPINVKNFGAQCNAQHVIGTGAMTAASAVFTDATAAFAATDVGKLFYVVGAGTGGKLLSTTIASWQSATQVTLANSAAVTVAGAEYIYGTDDTAAWRAAATAVQNNANCSIAVPYGLSLTDSIALKNNTIITGLQPDGWAFQNITRASGIILKPQSAGPAQFYGVNASVGNVQISNLLMDGAFRFQGNTVSRYSGGAIASGSNVFTDSTNGNFTSADIGKKIIIAGASSSGNSSTGAFFCSTIQSVTNSTTVVLEANHPASTTVTGAAYSYGFSTQQGLDGATTSASAVFSSASANFTSGDVGRRIEIYGASLPQWGNGTTNNGDGVGTLYSGTIISINSATSVTMSQNADLTLTGAQWRIGTVDAVWQSPSATSQDSMWHLSRIVMKNSSGNGYAVGNFQRANRLSNVYAWQCLGQGFLVASSDNNIERCMTAQCGESGLYINQSTNHILGLDSFSNQGNGVFLTSYAQQCSFISCSIDNNEKNGMLDFAKGTMRVAVRFTSNSQCANGLYSDLSVCRRYVGGVTNINQDGTTAVGCFWALGTAAAGYKPNWGIDAVGPYPISGTGVQYDSTTSPWVTSSITSGTVTALHQTSFQLRAGTSVNLGGNNTFVGSTTMGTKIGNSASELWGFYGAAPIIQPTVTGSKSSGAALTSLLTQLAALGLISDGTST